MKYTLLQLTQIILSSLDSDEVNSITDTVESQQVVKIIKTVYGDIAGQHNPGEGYTLFGLDPSGDSSKPTIMYLPTSIVQSVSWVKYNCATVDDTDTVFQDMKRVSLEEFLKRMHSYVPSEDTSLTAFDHTIGSQTVEFICRNDVAPSYYTSWDDFTFVFDAYDSAVDTTLQSSKTLCWGEKVLAWSEMDSYIIPLDDHQLLLHEAKALAHFEMKQNVHSKAERQARRAWIQMSRKKTAILDGDDYRTKTPNYGRK
jgi:hypothetical protein